MISVLSLAFIFAAALLLLFAAGSREVRLVATADIRCPARQILDVAESPARMPTWRRFPRWLPGPLRISVLACWGHPGYPNLGATRDPCRPAEEIRIRLVEDSEYIFRSLPRRGMQYESVFHVSSRNGVSRLRWEFGYRTRRPADVIGRAVVMASVRRSMSQTLDDISRNIPARQAFQASRRAYPSRAGHLPAA